MIRLKAVKKLKGEKKKYAAVFEKNGKEYIRKFGAAGMSDFTIHKDTERRERYISRHKKDLKTGDPMRAGYLSMYILWNKPSLQASITDFKRRLNVYNKTGKFPKDIKGSKKLSFGVRLIKVAKDIDGPLGFILQGDLAKGIEDTANATYIQDQLRNTILKDRSPKTKLIRELVRQGIKNQKQYGSNKYLKNLADNVDPLERFGSFFLRSMSQLRLEPSDFEPNTLFYKILLSSVESLEGYRNDFDSDNEAREDTQGNFYVISVYAIVDILQQITQYSPWLGDERNELYNLRAVVGWLKDDWLEKFRSYGVNYFGAPDNVVNKKLYEKIKAKIKKSIKGRRWGAYDSGRLVREYKAKGGKYRGSKGKTDLGRWYREKWVDACAWPKRKPCGRKTKESIAYCRPSKKVDSKTPKLVQKLTKAQIKSRCAKKKRNPMKRVTKFGNWKRKPSGIYISTDRYLPFDVNWTIHCTFIPNVGTHVTIRNESVSQTYGENEQHAYHYGIANWDRTGQPQFWGTGKLKRYLYRLPKKYKDYMVDYYNTVCENTIKYPEPIILPSPYKGTGFPPPAPQRFGNMYSVALLKRFLRENPKDGEAAFKAVDSYLEECKSKHQKSKCINFIIELLLNFYYTVQNKKHGNYKEFNLKFKELVKSYKRVNPKYNPYKFNLDKSRIRRFKMYLHILQDEEIMALLGNYVVLVSMINAMI